MKINVNGAEMNAVGYIATSWHSAILIYGFEYGVDDKVIVGAMNDHTYKTPRKHKVYYNSIGDAYIVFEGRRQYLDYFLKV